MVSSSITWHSVDSSGVDKKKVLLEMMVTLLFLGNSWCSIHYFMDHKLGLKFR